MTNHTQTRVIVADDHAIVRQGLCDLINSSETWRVVAQAADGEEAISLYATHPCDVMVLDISMGSMSGLEVAERLLRQEAAPRIVIVTMYTEAIFCLKALALGVRGYVLKSDAAESIMDCLNAVARGELYISNKINRHALIDEDGFPLLDKLEDDATQSPENPPDPLAKLSEKEIIVLNQIAELKNNKQIAREMNISLKTVQNHRYNICKKLGLFGRQALLHFAVRVFRNQ